MSISSASAVSNITTGGYLPPSPGVDNAALNNTVSAAAVEQSVSTKHAAQAVDQVNSAFSQRGQDLSASLVRDKATGITVVQVTEKSTNQVISQFPSKAIVALAEALVQSHSAKGNMVNVTG